MPYIGNTIRAADDYRLIDDISSGFNGSETSFALQVAGSAPVPFPKSPQQVLISVNGVIQEPDPTGSSGFNLVGTNIVFSSAPTNGHAFFGIIYATADYLNAGGNFPSGSLGAPSFTFIGDENTGLYRKGGGSVGFVSDATEIANFDSNGITISSGNLIIPDSIIHGGDSDTKIRFPAANTFSVETGGVERMRSGSENVFNETGVDMDFRVEGDTDANLLFGDASTDRIGIGTSTPSVKTQISVSDTTAYSASTISANQFQLSITNTGAAGVAGLLFVTEPSSGNGGHCGIRALSTGSGDSALTFSTRGSNTQAERMRIDSSGRLLLGTTTQGYSGGDDLTISTSGDTGLTIRSGTSNQGTIAFADGTSGNTQYRGFVQYFHNGDVLMFGTSAANRLKIDSSGHFLPDADSTYNIGSNGVRFANGYFDTLYGDGSNLTGITSTTINNNADNRIITGSGTANTLEGESQLTYTSNTLKNIASGATNFLLGSTNAGGVKITLDGDSDGDGSASDSATIEHDTTGNLHIRTDNPASTCSMAFSTNGSIKAIFDGANGHFRPGDDDTYDLGTSSFRWRNVYTTDLKLSNEGSSNDVDGTWGNYTIQEGAEDLFLINHRTGKKFKFNLTEVS